MPKCLTTDADPNFPVPNAARLVAHLRQIYDGETPVRPQSLAKVFGVSDNAILAVLRRAGLAGMVPEIKFHGWIPLET